MSSGQISSRQMDWLTIVALGALAYALTVFLHESTHALTCPIVGQPVVELNALYVDCGEGAGAANKIVAASASLINLLLGWLALVLLKRSSASRPSLRWFLWLFMLMNLLTGAGYWMFSGFANIGDWATVIAGWQPHWAWRLGMALLGSVTFMGFVVLALRELAKIIGGSEPELYGRAVKLGLISYFSAVGVVVLTGLVSPLGFLSLPVTAGLAAALGAMSPLIWMMFWFRAGMFNKTPGEALVISRSWPMVGLSVIMLLLYIFVLGRTLYF